MLLCMLILLVFLSTINANFVDNDIATHCDTEGYYWRDYKGVTPKDAFVGGLYIDGNVTYIGQVLYNNLLVPGELVGSEKRIYYEWGFQQFVATENVKILCTRHPEEFQWVITTNEDFKTLTDKDFVPGGYEPDNRIYIGRTIDGKKRLGKVQVRTSDQNAVLHYVEDGKGLFSDSFEVLRTVKMHEPKLGYYWRDYMGEIPVDALAGGKDIDGKTTYIGQTFHGGLKIPGVIHEAQKKMYYEWEHNEYLASDNVKILCTNQPDKFEWISTSDVNFKGLGDKTYVVGGNEPQNKIYIGRVYSDGGLLVGKLQVRNLDLNAVLRTTTRDHKSTEHHHFDVLVYNENLIRKSNNCKKLTINFYGEF